MDQKYLKKLSKQMSWILRHQAEQFDLKVDAEGYVQIEDLLTLLRETMPDASVEQMQMVIDTVEPHKQRFSIIDGYIRANYGHSLESGIEYEATEPPTVLFHGTTIAAKSKILELGLLPMNRQFVHLTTDVVLAKQVGGRHGTPCLLRVDAARAYRDGCSFYNANRGFWLIASVPACYLSMYESAC
jgi:putative RNA 2'-phosphotransferase